MEDYKVIVYIILAILYFLFSGKKKKKAPPPVRTEQERKSPPVEYSRPEPIKPKPMESRPAPAPAVPEPQPYSLEDILREFGQTLEEKTGGYEEVVERKPDILEEPVRKTVDYDEDLKTEEASMETIADKVTLPLPVQKEHFASYPADAQEKPNKYAAMFADPEGVRSAFIAGEIFNRKY